ncbi:MAG: ethylbenzene dehydrogenase-related protein [Pseudomonadota bacterium]
MRHLPFALAALAALAVPATGADTADTIVEANTALLDAGDVVEVAKIPDGIYLRTANDPDDIIWERLPEYRVHMAPAPAVHPSVELRVDYDDPGYYVYLQLARTSERLYVRMRWRDDTHDGTTSRDRFGDAAAVQFSLGDDATSYLMGTGPQEPVNIWYWRGDGSPVQNLAAGGYGSTTILPTQSVTGAGHYEENTGDPNEWAVVMSRPLAVSGDYEVSFRRYEVPAAFAVWQGSDQQRDGFKHVSNGWIILDMSED